jgi:hypothetical protein
LPCARFAVGATADLCGYTVARSSQTLQVSGLTTAQCHNEHIRNECAGDGWANRVPRRFTRTNHPWLRLNRRQQLTFAMYGPDARNNQSPASINHRPTMSWIAFSPWSHAHAGD